jgi:hypothetical protein
MKKEIAEWQKEHHNNFLVIFAVFHASDGKTFQLKYENSALGFPYVCSFEPLL